jgi:hypothetical protein
MGRPTVFRNKPPANDVHGRLTDEGWRLLQEARRTLAKLVDWKPDKITDSDAIEFALRGEKNTRAYLKSGKMS